MRFAEVLDALTPARFAALPGIGAQAALAPRPRIRWVPGQVPADARRAAALMLLYPSGDDTALLLTVRGAHLLHHQGQVALPGGAIEAGESVEAAALREAGEEVGLDAAAVTLRGRLTALHVPVSGYVVEPVVGTAAVRPDVRSSEREVERLLEVPLDHLASPGTLRVEVSERDGVSMSIPFFDLGGVKLWGATAMIVGELLALLGQRPDPWRLP